MTVYSKRSIEKEKVMAPETHSYDLTNERYGVDFEDEVKPSNSV